MIWFIPLLAYGAFIWYVPTSGEDLSEQLPIALGLSLVYLLGRPWNLKASQISWSRLLPAALLTLFAIASANTLFNTLALTYWFILWRGSCLTDETRTRTAPLIVLFALSFPWVQRDLDFVGWWFRYSAASCSATIWSLFGFETYQQGTNVLIGPIALFVEPVCSGLNTLQALLMAGTIAAYSLFGNASRFWYNLLIIPFAAWTANFLRVLLLTALALATSPTEMSETTHTLVGMSTILLCYLLAYAFFEGQVTPNTPPSHAQHYSFCHLDPLHYLLFLITLFASSSIIYAWEWSPFDIYGPIACAIWLTPILLDKVPKNTHLVFPLFWGITATIFLIAGAISSTNVFKHTALVILLFSMKATRCNPIAEWLWRISAISWLPIFGLFFSPFQLQGVHILRIALATCMTLPVLLLPAKEQQQ